MKKLGALFILAAASTLVSAQEPSDSVQTEIPVSDLNVDMLFTCGIPGLPTVVIYYDRNDASRRSLTYWQAREPEVAFLLQDAVTSVVKEKQDSETRWTIYASGRVENAKGISEGTPARLALIIIQGEAGGLTMDFNIDAEGFSRAERACPRGPNVDRRSRTAA